MKTMFLAAAASFVLMTAVPTLAAEPTATGRPAQLTQKPDDAGKDKTKGVAKKKENTRANKSGAARGDSRSDQVHDMTKAR